MRHALKSTNSFVKRREVPSLLKRRRSWGHLDFGLFDLIHLKVKRAFIALFYFEILGNYL